jgi:hypothetical protein
MMDIVELVLDENAEVNGIDAISIVEHPAIEEDFIALKSDKVEFAQVDAEKRILMGAALVPNKPIYRNDGEKEFYVYFSEKTIRRASELFFIKGNQNKATLEHEMDIKGLSVVESWIVEDPEMDKTKLYGLSAVKGQWQVTMKVENEEVWNDYVKTGKVKGFSIEGWFVDKKETMSKAESLAKAKLDIIRSIIEEDLENTTSK